jgi:hypothetical protein
MENRILGLRVSDKGKLGLLIWILLENRGISVLLLIMQGGGVVAIAILTQHFGYTHLGVP